MSSALTIDDGGFVVTKEYRRFVEFADACRRYHYIGLCYGPPGVGKTLSARHYAKWDILANYVELDHIRPDDGRPPDVARNCTTIFYTPTVANSPNKIWRHITELRMNVDYVHAEALCETDYQLKKYERPPDVVDLIIVDEADRLKLAGLEQVRDIFDRDGNVGLILMGMPGLEKRLARYAQLYSRVGFVHEFRPLSPAEVKFILEQKWRQIGLEMRPDDFTDTEALATITRITGGNFRLIHRLWAQVQRILAINELKTVTQEVVEAARQSLVIGVS